MMAGGEGRDGRRGMKSRAVSVPILLGKRDMPWVYIPSSPFLPPSSTRSHVPNLSSVPNLFSVPQFDSNPRLPSDFPDSGFRNPAPSAICANPRHSPLPRPQELTCCRQLSPSSLETSLARQASVPTLFGRIPGPAGVALPNRKQVGLPPEPSMRFRRCINFMWGRRM